MIVSCICLAAALATSGGSVKIRGYGEIEASFAPKAARFQCKTLDDGDHCTDTLFSISERCPVEGRLTAVLRAGRTPGVVKVRCQAKGFAPVEAKLETRPDDR